MLRHTLVTSLCAAALLAACSNGGMTEPSTIAPTVATVAIPTTTMAVVTSTSTTSTTAVPAGTTSPPSTEVPTVTLSPDGPWTRVDSAPGVTTAGLVYELMPKLWVYLPTEIDLEHGITWTFNETDRPVIEAYLQARLVYFQSITSNPIDLDHPGWKQWYADGGAAYLDSLKERVRNGEIGSLDVGVVLRPSVLGEDRTEVDAIVVDCVLDGGVFLEADGSLAVGSTRGVSESGLGMRMHAAEGAWFVTQVGRQDDACLDF